MYKAKIWRKAKNLREAKIWRRLKFARAKIWRKAKKLHETEIWRKAKNLHKAKIWRKAKFLGKVVHFAEKFSQKFFISLKMYIFAQKYCLKVVCKTDKAERLADKTEVALFMKNK